MKRRIALFMAVVLVVALFSGCGGNAGVTETPSPSAKTTQTPTTAAPKPDEQPVETSEPQPVEPDSPYRLANGNFPKDANGFPTSKYEYELPLTTADEVFTDFCICWQPQYLPEDGIAGMPAAQHLDEGTGVHMEYIYTSNANFAKEYAVLLASDDLADITESGISYYTGTVEDAIYNEKYFVNIYDYLDYCPNYIYEAAVRDPGDIGTLKAVFYAPELIPTFCTLKDKTLVQMASAVRGDWLDQIGVNASDIHTIDQFHDLMLALKSQIASCTFPWAMLNVIESTGSFAFNCYDTLMYVSTKGELPMIHQRDGKAEFSLVTEGDRQLLEFLSTCYAEGLIHPQFSGSASNTDYNELRNNSEVGYCVTSPSGMAGFASQCVDPSCNWVALSKFLLEEGQTIHIRDARARGTLKAGSAISARCENIPLLISYCDYGYSDTGAMELALGIEDYTYYYTEDGQIRLTDLMLHNENGLNVDWTYYLYVMCGYVGHFLDFSLKKYNYEGGDAYAKMYDIWDDYSYDGAYMWPDGLNLTAEQNDILATYAADISTFISESICSFIDGSKPMSEWDSYLRTLNDVGIETCRGVYQEAYDAFTA